MIVWSPYYNFYNLKLEKVQRRFLRFLCYKTDGSYPKGNVNFNDIQIKHKIDSLEYRRITIFLIFLYKLVHNTIDCSFLLSRLNIHVPGYITRNQEYFVVKKSRTNVSRKAPIYVMSHYFNLISTEIDINHCTCKELIQKISNIL